MSSKLDLSVIVSTYQRPLHLQRCLLSLAGQRRVSGRFEVIVVDDGSLDDTPRMVRRLASEVDFPLHFVTHPHNGFQLSRCRNLGIRMARAPYLVLADGDCLFPPNHLARQLEARRPGVVRAGHSIRLDQRVSAAIDADAVRSGAWLRSISRRSQWGQYRHYLRSEWERWIRHPSRPKLVGNSIGVWREQLQLINGFDEEFRGWGCEDDDLRRRLVQSGQQIRTFSWFGVSFHMWHPADCTAPDQWRNGNNVDYFRRPVVLTSCLHGLQPRTVDQIRIQVTVGNRTPADDPMLRLANRLKLLLGNPSGSAELELLFCPSATGFCTKAASRIAIHSIGHTLPYAIRRGANAIIRVPEAADAEFVVRELSRLAGIRDPAAILVAA